MKLNASVWLTAVTATTLYLSTVGSANSQVCGVNCEALFCSTVMDALVCDPSSYFNCKQAVAAACRSYQQLKTGNAPQRISESIIPSILYGHGGLAIQLSREQVISDGTIVRLPPQVSSIAIGTRRSGTVHRGEVANCAVTINANDVFAIVLFTEKPRNWDSWKPGDRWIGTNASTSSNCGFEVSSPLSSVDGVILTLVDTSMSALGRFSYYFTALR